MPRAPCSRQLSSQRRDTRRRLGSEREVGLKELRQGQEKPFCPQPPPPRALHLSRAKARLSPSLCPPGHHFSMGVGQGHGPSVPTAPIAPAGTDTSMQEERWPLQKPASQCWTCSTMLRWRTCKLLLVKYYAPCTPPSDRGWGGRIQGKTAPTASWGPSLAWTGSSPLGAGA